MTLPYMQDVEDSSSWLATVSGPEDMTLIYDDDDTYRPAQSLARTDEIAAEPPGDK
jgi:hypothetical protein